MTDSSQRLSRQGVIEIIFGSVLSILLGIVAGALFLLLKPVPVLEQPPKEFKDGEVYCQLGKKDWNAGRRWMFKRDSFLQGHTVSVTEDELNAWVDSIFPSNPVTTKKQVDAPFFQQATPNLRLTSDRLILSMVCKLSLADMTRDLVVQVEGRFEKAHGAVVFWPEKLYLGSLPVHMLQPLKAIVFPQLTGLFELPADVVQSWSKLDDVRVEHSELVLGFAGS